MAFTVLACCKRHCSLYFLEPCWRVCGAGPRGLVFVFQATINALCAPAWRKNQSSRLPRQKGPVLSAENPDVNWPCQIPAREKNQYFHPIQERLSQRFLDFLSHPHWVWTTTVTCQQKSLCFSWVPSLSRFFPWWCSPGSIIYPLTINHQPERATLSCSSSPP